MRFAGDQGVRYGPWRVQGKALLGGPGGDAHRKLHDFSDFEGFHNHLSSMSRLILS
ncbi:hypothetical protein DPMN_147339 [Dreissena polymorpha]|uniref:Uncharacterized protein n=1 Tax=Dreissena polymorpha TaxID=45954 RepID=A0A9D4FDJ1_DREPO|nr:hypothetical protein DPMN_147339 [Dreissena polymorpha]